MQCNSTGVAATYGLCFGRKATVLPTTDHVLKVIRDRKISKMLLSPTDVGVIPILDAIMNDQDLRSRMKIVLCVGYKDLAPLANDFGAKEWVNKYIGGRESRSIVSDICVGDVIQSDDIKNAIVKAALQGLRSLLPAPIKLSALVTMSNLVGTYEADTVPSSFRLTADATELLRIIHNVNDGQIPLFVRIMPFFKMSQTAKLENCLLKDGAQPYMPDGQYNYTQVYDAMLDSICCALSKEHQDLRKADLYVVSGWPTDGPKAEASSSNAKIYIPNFVKHFKGLTPRNNKPAGIFVYSLGNEDMIDTAVEEFKHLGAEPYLP